MPIQWMPGFIGLLALVAFVVIPVQSSPFRGGVVTDATVVAIETRRSRMVSSGTPRTSKTYAPRVEFVDGAGVTRTVTSSLSGGVPPTVGSTVRVSYLPARPDAARILGDARTRVGRYVLLVVGLGFTAAAVALWLT